MYPVMRPDSHRIVVRKEDAGKINLTELQSLERDEIVFRNLHRYTAMHKEFYGSNSCWISNTYRYMVHFLTRILNFIVWNVLQARKSPTENVQVNQWNHKYLRLGSGWRIERVKNISRHGNVFTDAQKLIQALKNSHRLSCMLGLCH